MPNRIAGQRLKPSPPFEERVFNSLGHSFNAYAPMTRAHHKNRFADLAKPLSGPEPGLLAWPAALKAGPIGPFGVKLPQCRAG
jgi:hypothetical protein